MTETHQRQFKGVWIRGAIWQDRGLTWKEKCLYGEIEALDPALVGTDSATDYLVAKFRTNARVVERVISLWRGMQ